MPIVNNWVSGAYKILWSGQDMGATEVGFEMISRPSFNVIRADFAGRTPLDAIWTGIEDIVIRAESIEYAANLWAKANWALYNGVEGVGRSAGTFLSALAQPLILEAYKLGQGLPRYVFNRAIPLEPLRSVFSAQSLRRIPLGFYVFAQQVDSSSLVPTMYDIPTTP